MLGARKTHCSAAIPGSSVSKDDPQRFHRILLGRLFCQPQSLAFNSVMTTSVHICIVVSVRDPPKEDCLGSKISLMMLHSLLC
jgi:hypothetical protein